MKDVVHSQAATGSDCRAMERNSVCLFGAAPDTGNLGVSALCYSTLHGLYQVSPELAVTVFDHTPGARVDSIELGEGEVPFQRRGASHSRRYYRAESLWNMRVSGWLGGFGNPHLRAIRSAAAVLDISGGDSFTDLYGPRRFGAVTLPKVIAIEQRVPLILLPQTYGPFVSPQARKAAERIVRRAAFAWARDERSFNLLRELLGGEFDAARHRSGVDVAFALPAVRPANLPKQVTSWLSKRSGPVVGLNVSGLIYNHAAKGPKFGFRANYRELILRTAARLLKESDCRLLLVPHVVTPPGHYESDFDASNDVLRNLGNHATDRVIIVPAMAHPSHVKWIIAQTDWFCGTRMHSTIAGLSSGVATAAVAYSPKTLGVFETCGQGSCVADPRILDTDEVVDHLWRCFIDRTATADGLRKHVSGMTEQVRYQFQQIIEASGIATAPHGQLIRS